MLKPKNITVNIIISTLVFYLISAVNSDMLLCDLCVCTFNSDQDYNEMIDCSYKTRVLYTNLSLTSHAYALDLSWNNLTKLEPTNLLRSKTVAELYLNNNNLEDISIDSIILPELRRLDLSFNELEVIHEDVFKSITKLEYLNLANNKFTTFTKLTFHHLSNLKEIILDNNKIGATFTHTNIFDRNGFGLTHKIKNISMSGIEINKVPDNFFSDAYDIRKLVISRNNLTDIFEIPYTLEYLDLSDNPIKQIVMEDFIDLPALKVLKLNNLAISEIPDYVFSSLHSLERLELERNANLTLFSELSFGHEVLDDADDFLLERLSLRGSRLSHLDEQLLEPFGKLIKLDLQGNPWRCDCKIKWFKKLQIQPNDYEHVRCATPNNLYNSKIFEIKPKYLVCQRNKHLIGVSIAVISLCASLAAAAVWLFIFLPRQRSSTFLNMYASSAQYSALPMGRNDI